MTSSRRGPSRPTFFISWSAAHALHCGLANAVLVLLALWVQAFGLSLTQAGALGSAFHAAMTAGRAPSGFVAGRLGGRRLLVLGTLGTAVGWLLLAEADGFRALLMALLIAGVGSGIRPPPASGSWGLARRDETSRTALRVPDIAGEAGRAIVPALLAVGVGAIGWRASSHACGIAMAVVALLTHLILQRLASRASPPAPSGATSSGPEVADRPGFGLPDLLAVVDAASRSGFLWLLPFLMVEKGLPVEQVGFAVALLFIGGAAGKLVHGFVAGRHGAGRVMALTRVAAAVGIIAAVAAPMGVLWALLVPVGAVLAGSSEIAGIAWTSPTSCPTTGAVAHAEHEAPGSGRLHGATMAAGAVAPLALGVLADSIGLAFSAMLVAVLALSAAPIAIVLAPGRRNPPGARS